MQDEGADEAEDLNLEVLLDQVVHGARITWSDQVVHGLCLSLVLICQREEEADDSHLEGVDHDADHEVSLHLPLRELLIPHLLLILNAQDLIGVVPVLKP